MTHIHTHTSFGRMLHIKNTRTAFQLAGGEGVSVTAATRIRYIRSPHWLESVSGITYKMQLSPPPLQSLTITDFVASGTGPQHVYYAGNIPRDVLESLVPAIASSGVTIISTDTSFAPTGTSPAANTCSLRASATAKKGSGAVRIRSSALRAGMIVDEIRIWGSPKSGFGCPRAEAMVEYEERNRS
jgi:hypothetical protein